MHSTKFLPPILALFCFSDLVNSQRGRKRTSQQLVSDIYHGCGFDKFCLKICHERQALCIDCIKRRQCPAMVSVEFRDDKYFTQMIIKRLGASHEFISIGLSSDLRMGNDPIVVCVALSDTGIRTNLNRTLNQFGAWTTGLKTMEYNIPDDAHPFTDMRHEIIDGVYVCSFQWKIRFTMMGIDFNLDEDKFHLMAARGEASTGWKLDGHHKSRIGRVISRERVTLQFVPEFDDYDESFDGKAISNVISNIFLLACLTLPTTYYFTEIIV